MPSSRAIWDTLHPSSRRRATRSIRSADCVESPCWPGRRPVAGVPINAGPPWSPAPAAPDLRARPASSPRRDGPRHRPGCGPGRSTADSAGRSSSSRFPLELLDETPDFLPGDPNGPAETDHSDRAGLDAAAHVRRGAAQCRRRVHDREQFGGDPGFDGASVHGPDDTGFSTIETYPTRLEGLGPSKPGTPWYTTD